MSGRTFPVVLAGLLRDAGARPLVTFYDDATGERVELSVATYANWVAKTAGLLTDELDLERGDLVVLDVPTHWLGPVWLGGLWTVGARVTPDTSRSEEAALVVSGQREVAGFGDVWSAVLAMPDAFVATDPPTPGDAAWVDGRGTLSQADLFSVQHRGERLLTDLNPCSSDGLETFTGTVAGGGSAVWVAHPDEARWSARYGEERASRALRR